MFPYLKEKVPGGSGVRPALLNLMLIAGFLYLIKPVYGMFSSNKVEKEKIAYEKRLEELVKIEMANIASKTIPTEKVNSVGVFVENDEVIIEEKKEDLILEFLYSYYNPNLGGVNCHVDNWDIDTGLCKNITASGKGWMEYFGKGIAIHPDYLDVLPFGTMVEIIEPELIKGIYEVIDLCPGCGPRYNSNLFYIDILDRNQKLPWSEKIKLRIIENE